MALGQQTEEPLRTAGGVLVDIGVPTRGKRKAEVMRQAGAEHADFAGAGNVNEVGLEPFKNLADEGDVAEKGGVEAEVFFEGEGQEAAGQFKGPDVAVFEDGLRAVAGADAEEGQVAAARKGFKMAAAVGYPVDLVERVGKVGDAGDLCIHWLNRSPCRVVRCGR